MKLVLYSEDRILKLETLLQTIVMSRDRCLNVEGIIAELLASTLNNFLIDFEEYNET